MVAPLIKDQRSSFLFVQCNRKTRRWLEIIPWCLSIRIESWAVASICNADRNLAQMQVDWFISLYRQHLGPIFKSLEIAPKTVKLFFGSIFLIWNFAKEWCTQTWYIVIWRCIGSARCRRWCRRGGPSACRPSSCQRCRRRFVCLFVCLFLCLLL